MTTLLHIFSVFVIQRVLYLCTMYKLLKTLTDPVNFLLSLISTVSVRIRFFGVVPSFWCSLWFIYNVKLHLCTEVCYCLLNFALFWMCWWNIWECLDSMTQYKDFQILVRAEFDQNSETEPQKWLRWDDWLSKWLMFTVTAQVNIHLLKWENDNIDW